MNNIARWNGSAWNQIGNGIRAVSPEFNTSVYALATWNPEVGPQNQLLAVGDTGVYRWLGTGNWQRIGSGFGTGLRAITTWDPDAEGPQPASVYIGGTFNVVGSASLNNVARWNGLAWLPLGSGVNGPVRAFTVWDPDEDGPAISELVVGGAFQQASGIVVNRIACWNGEQWRALGGGLQLPTSQNQATVSALREFDADGRSGRSPQLIAALGALDLGRAYDGMNTIYHWDGRSWQPLGHGLQQSMNALLVSNSTETTSQVSELVAAGVFDAYRHDLHLEAGFTLGQVVRWRCPPEASACLRGDSNGDDLVAFNDIDCFVAALIDEAAWAGCGTRLDSAVYVCAHDGDCDGRIGLNDIDPFVQGLVAGACPPCP